MSHRSGSSRTRIQSVCILFGIALFVLLPATGSASPADSLGRESQTAIDSDGDGIADDFDPDDDNDGTSDDQEGSAGNPGPDILDPGKDTDDDGISNVLDPDDNNNGVTDEEDPQSFPPTSSGGSTNPPSAEPSTSPGPSSTNTGTSASTSTSTSNQAEPDPLIQALPVTGSGTEIGAELLSTLLAAITTLLAATATVLRAHRAPTTTGLTKR